MYDAIATISKLRINHNSNIFPPFVIPAHGVKVMDEVAGVVYETDRSGNKKSSVKSLTGSYSPPNNPKPIDFNLNVLFGWLAILGAILFSIVALRMWYRKRLLTS